MKPVFAVYSSFLQRGYDQIVHDVCMQNLPVIFAIDRAGLVGNDGETHQGVYDVAYLSHIPNMTILAPKNRQEFEEMMTFAVNHNGPVAIRYPRGNVYEGLAEYKAPILYGKSEVITKESEIAIFGCGHMMETAEQVWKSLKEKGYSCSLINSRFVKPMDTDVLCEMSDGHRLFVTIEDAAVTGGYGDRVMRYVSEQNMGVKVLTMGVPDCFVEHGNIPQLREQIGLDTVSIVEKIEHAWENL
jgi:1-deoxy-D-xylulose-5-phosphate synthase